MKKLLASLLLILATTVSANAQFEKDVFECFVDRSRLVA